MDKPRTIRYMQRRYEDMAEKQLKIQRDVIIARLISAGGWQYDALVNIIAELQQSGWSLAKIVAHMDLLDLDDRI